MHSGKKINIYKMKYKRFNGDIKKVSVIIPNYNYQDYIIERIDSVLRQSYPIYELIILDDKSTDNSVKVIKDKIKTIKDVKVKFISNDKNSGCVFKQWKKGIKEATGNYFWIAEADDLANPKFLEEAMKGFNDSDVLISYVESARIDENNRLITNNSQDLYNIFASNHWNSNYINDGEDELKNYLSAVNTILNVSSVVWKKDNYDAILDEATKFKVAGDWYIYCKLMEMGKVAFSSKPYNYFRKHSKSVSTVIKDDIEYKEICRIQDEIADKHHLTLQQLFNQRRRRNFMDSKVSKDIHKKRVAWVIPHPGKGSGGHRTIIQNINALVMAGYECDIYVEEDFVSTDAIVKQKVDEYYGYCAANVYVGVKLRQDYELVFATGWKTVDFVKNINCDRYGYFIQDYEPWFLPMGGNYIKTENSYRLGYKPITIGKWLSSKMINEYNLDSQYFDFCADLNVYKRIESIEKENAICYIYQPEKPRRCDEIGINALKIVKYLRPDVKIYLYGSTMKKSIDFEVTKLGIIPIEQCNELYNKCKLGLCISASNPSRIPFEMMAAGLPVVEIYKENNLYDFPEGGIKLAEPTAEAIASAIIELLDNPKELSKMSKIGLNYMKDYPLEKGYEQFVKAVNNLFTDKKVNITINKTYNLKPVKPSKEVKDNVHKILHDENIISSDRCPKTKIRRIRNRIKEILKAVFKKIERLIDKL